MSVGLGSTITDPKYILVQILHTLSTFFLTLGVARVALGILSVMLFRDNTLSFLDALSTCFHIPLRSLFVVVVLDVGDGSPMRFFFMHMLAGLGLSYPLARTIQRQKFVFDFTLTLYVIYFLLCCMVEQQFMSNGLPWWIGVLGGFAVTYGATSAVCRWQELQHVCLPQSATTDGGGSLDLVTGKGDSHGHYQSSPRRRMLSPTPASRIAERDVHSRLRVASPVPSASETRALRVESPARHGGVW
ncbi:hypothetical protein TRVL_03228 [Trypanosoma vivax]|nr:hypothetical protein TRVL_03228 [Trypanosoma vivax]